MRKKIKLSLITTLCLTGLAITTPSVTANAATFGNSNSGASSTESMQIRYTGAAWNYSKSPYKSTSFKYTRNGKTLLSKTAYNGKVTGSVWDDLRWGNKYTTKFSWSRGSRK